jgi:hypothetical protein
MEETGVPEMERPRMSRDANARGTRPSLGHIPGLDGVRALSVLAIIAFRTGLNSVPGGYYGVDVDDAGGHVDGRQGLRVRPQPGRRPERQVLADHRALQHPL